MWAVYCLLALGVLAYIGDKQGQKKYGDRYKFDDGVDR